MLPWPSLKHLLDLVAYSSLLPYRHSAFPVGAQLGLLVLSSAERSRVPWSKLRVKHNYNLFLNTRLLGPNK